MAGAKGILLRPIGASEAREFVRRTHYSGKVVNNSQLHLGVFWNGKLEGVMQFGPSLDKRKVQGLVSGTGWNEFIELNRLAFSDVLPRNSESRALGIAMRLLRKHAPHIKWVVSFADATQCGDGTIYRAAGFVLTQIVRNRGLYIFPDGEAFHSLDVTGLGPKVSPKVKAKIMARMTITANRAKFLNGAASTRGLEESGVKLLPGYQLRYVFFVDPAYRERLTVPVLPFSAIDEAGAGMYRGKARAASIDSDAAGFHPAKGGATPTAALHLSPEPERA